jgi:hypothetical protein
MASAGMERLSREDWKKKQELDELVLIAWILDRRVFCLL